MKAIQPWKNVQALNIQLIVSSSPLLIGAGLHEWLSKAHVKELFYRLFSFFSHFVS
jgi:hypothetical protein